MGALRIRDALEKQRAKVLGIGFRYRILVISRLLRVIRLQ